MGLAVERSTVFLSVWGDGRARRAWRGLVCASAVALGVTVVQVVDPAPAVAAPPTAPETVSSRPDVVSAGVSARAQGARVEVESLRTETSSTWANPDGTMTTQAHASQQRFKNAKGKWVEVDLSLTETAEGTVAPKAHPDGLSLAGRTRGAGRGEKSATETDVALVDAGSGLVKSSRSVSLGWPGALGKPALNGATATYPEAVGGVDPCLSAWCEPAPWLGCVSVDGARN